MKGSTLPLPLSHTHVLSLFKSILHSIQSTLTNLPLSHTQSDTQTHSVANLPVSRTDWRAPSPSPSISRTEWRTHSRQLLLSDTQSRGHARSYSHKYTEWTAHSLSHPYFRSLTYFFLLEKSGRHERFSPGKSAISKVQCSLPFQVRQILKFSNKKQSVKFTLLFSRMIA